MPVTATFMALAALLAAGVVGAFFWLTAPPKCPRCGARDWVANPHLGRYAAYCKKCTLQVDMANWKGTP